MERNDDVIELGAASIETKGPVGQITDAKLGLGATGLHQD
ncbi:benenodin family lasso peptide [Sphingomonas sp. UYP23]